MTNKGILHQKIKINQQYLFLLITKKIKIPEGSTRQEEIDKTLDILILFKKELEQLGE